MTAKMWEGMLWRFLTLLFFLLSLFTQTGKEASALYLQLPTIVQIYLGLLIAFAILEIPRACMIFWIWAFGYPASIGAVMIYNKIKKTKNKPNVLIEYDSELFKLHK